jgi:hypothetical protein
MAKEFFLPAPLYLQDDCYKDTHVKCGAACTQMVLHDIDPQRPLKTGEQDRLFDDIRTPPTGGGAWYNPPQGIRRVLDIEKPAARPPQRSVLNPDIQAIFTSPPVDPATPYNFIIFGDSSRENDPNPGILRAPDVSDQIEQIEEISKQLIRTVALRGAAPIIAVREDNAHWIVVNGFVVEDDYRDADLGQRDMIKAIYIRNPLGRYTYSTVACGNLTDQQMQVITGHTCELNPHVQDVAPYATWVREYMYSDWAETFVEVCDSSAPGTEEFLARVNRLASRTREKSATSEIRNWFARWDRTYRRMLMSEEITPAEAVERARLAIEEFNLSRLNPRVTPRNALPPYKVKRLDRIDGNYYLVPVGVENKISALINISVYGEFDEATVWPVNIEREPGKITDEPKGRQTAEIKQDKDTVESNAAISSLNDHYIAPFDHHPQFSALTAGQSSILRGRTIRLTNGGPLLTIAGVIRDQTTPYVWRPGPNSFSASRPFHNLKVTVQGSNTPISLYLPVDDYCLSTDGSGAISLPSPNYLEMVADCIKQQAGSMVDEVLVEISRSGTTAMVMYKSNQTKDIEDELDAMRVIICQCLKDHPSPGLTYFRIKAYATNAFLTRLRGGGELDGLGTAPASGGGGGYSISTCL